MRFLPRSTSALAFSLLGLLGLSGCGPAGNAPPSEQLGRRSDPWDSQGGNPTHATHSYLTELAIDQLKADFPEVDAYRAEVVDGANHELHDLPLADAEQEALRLELGGTNGGCLHPELVWAHALERREAYDDAKAYWFLGLLLHYVEDMAVPAHALHVYHQASLGNLDNFELMALQKWSPSYDLNRGDPGYSDPSDYVAWSGSWAAADFHATWPGKTYTRSFFSASWLFASGTQKTFMRRRQGRAAMAATWALESALASF